MRVDISTSTHPNSVMKIGMADWKRMKTFGCRKIKISTHGYAYFNLKRKIYIIARFIMETPKGMECDHIHHHKLDNRQSQLRNCTHAENSKNRGLYSSNTKGYTGIGRKKGSHRWGAGIVHEGRTISLGHFNTFAEAVVARREGEIKYRGEYCMKRIHLNIWKLIREKK